ncbi:uncharacterized protein YjlB [Palleronia aestuarii]|uniref:Uncharacterized protein YjlB n=1 Tax=Palleronia aestuarii TaxID=568105 RepID=A0A2W7NFQ4_9RHOB|nr:cupin domain-containing protein [Palleronia aestuarii]PZX17007.1 uncharacterized protein YjlB [Palleronia aestuarii]
MSGSRKGGVLVARVMPETEVRVETRHLDGGEAVPNNPDLPVLVLRGALDAGAGPEAVTARLEKSGWGGTWVWGVFEYHHYHPNAHEALAVASGHALLMLGGPEGRTVEVSAGDVLVLPAGTGHCQIEASGDFRVCGAYPPGQEDYGTIQAEEPPDPSVRDRIAAVPLPRTDPVHGGTGPLLDAWGGK